MAGPKAARTLTRHGVPERAAKRGRSAVVASAPALAALVLLGLVLPGRTDAVPLESAARLSRELHAAGRAEVTLRYELPSATGGAPRVVHGALALEPPDRVRLDVTATGEHLVARADGGEWLQPATRQVLHFRARHVVAALRWWRVLLGEDGNVREHRAGPARWVLVLQGEGGSADSATVWLDGRGLPARLELTGGDGPVAYRLSGWHFARARGAAAFRLATPPGYETVEMP
jgi:hypothetical protein